MHFRGKSAKLYEFFCLLFLRNENESLLYTIQNVLAFHIASESGLNVKRPAIPKYLEMTLTDRSVVKFTNSFLQRRSIRTGTVPIISILSQKFQFFKNYRSEDLSISRQFQVQFQFVFEHARYLPGPLVQFRPCSEPCPPPFG